MGWINPFGGQPQNPSQVSLLDLSLTSDVALFWPWTGEQLDQVQAKIMRVTPDVINRNIDLADATQASPGEATMFINVGSHTFNVNDSTGANVTTIASGTAKFVYLFDNSTAGGGWGVFTFGTGSSGADASALAGAGLMAIAGTLNESMSVTDVSSTGFNLTSAARANLYNWTGGAGAFTTDDPATLGSSWFACVKNSGSGALSLTPAAGTIDGGASKSFNPGDAAFIIRDGSNLITLGFGQSAAFSFDYISLNVAGTGSFTLNTSQQNRISYNLTGVLTGNRTIIVPATVQQYWFTNSTTGAFTLSLKANGSGAAALVLAAGAANIFYCNGTDLVVAVSGSGISTPVSIANGGTGATTASGARTNLGSTTVGDALFTAASAAAARSALGLGLLAVKNTVGNSDIDNLSVNAAKISADAVTTIKILDANVTTAKIANNAVTFAKMQAITDGKLLGASGGTAVEEITVGTGLSLSANTLSASGTSGFLRVTLYTGSGTWTKGIDVGSVIVEVQGAGGSGARSNTNTDAPTGGQAGSWAISTIILAASLGATETVTIGAGGTAVAGSSSANGNAGGSTSFGAHVVCPGGIGGIFDSSVPVFITTFATPSGTHVQSSVKSVNGESAQAFATAAGATAKGIMGASSSYGNSGLPNVNASTNAVNASGFGAGGCSAANVINGVTSGAGSGGLILVYEYA